MKNPEDISQANIRAAKVTTKPSIERKVQVSIVKENLIRNKYGDLSKSDIVYQLWNNVYQANIRNPKLKIPMLS